ncbi:hypothetical protein Tco_1580106 [Tanacetum coccineum]
MLAICVADKPVVFKAPKPSSITERVPQGTKHGAQLGHKKQSSLKQSSVSRKETTKGGSSKAPTGSKTSHSKKRKESILGMDSNPSQPPVSTTMDLEMHKEDQQATGGPTSLEVTTKGGSSKAPTGSKTSHSKKRKESISGMDSNLSQPPVSTTMDPEMHKEDQQATGSPTSLEVTSEARANPWLSSGMSAFNLNEPIYSASFIIHYESASGNDALVVSIAKANP